jgi:hypothetical protein
MQVPGVSEMNTIYLIRMIRNFMSSEVMSFPFNLVEGRIAKCECSRTSDEDIQNNLNELSET